MRGRSQALLVAFAGAFSSLFCWVSAAVIALVTLRRGVGSGAWLLFWALLPAVALAWVYGDSGPLSLLLGTAVLAATLRSTVSLSLAVLVSVPVGVFMGLAALTLGGDYLAQMAELFGQFLASMEQRLSQGGEQVALQRPTVGQIAGLLGAGTASMSVCCLLLARYWQAALYNPGGFGREFRELYYPAAMATALVLAGLVLSSVGSGLQTWAMICFVPLTFAGLALVHSWAAHRGRGGGWIAWFYIAWLLLDPVKLVVVFLAIADSWINFRRRWAATGGADGTTLPGPREDRGDSDGSAGADDRDDTDDESDKQDFK